MNFVKNGAQIYVPDGSDEAFALSRTTDLCVCAHQDDIEIEAFGAISACMASDKRHFTGVTVTDGAGCPRSGEFAAMTDEDMKRVRAAEQNAAADAGHYSAQLQLYYSSAEVKDAGNKSTVRELAEIIAAASPDVLYTHNPADKHDTHVAVSLRTLAAVMSLPAEKRPRRVVVLEGWRDLDWLDDGEKYLMDTSDEKNALAVLSVFKSQIAGGKRYDLASLGRRLANATFYASHSVDSFASASYGLDITAKLYAGESPAVIAADCISRFAADVAQRIGKLSL